MMIRKLSVLFLMPILLFASEIPNFRDLHKCKNATFFLSTRKSGSNVISGSLSAITRKPISWLHWRYEVFDPSYGHTAHPSYNRLELPLVSNVPLMYRTHFDFFHLKQVPSQQNRLIFVTRNPKELIYRAFFLTSPSLPDPTPDFIDPFLAAYLETFEMYQSWNSHNRALVFYEDFIRDEEGILLHLLDFMNEKPLFYDDFVENKQKYMSCLLDSYKQQHKGNSGGISSRNGPQEIYYSKNASLETLRYIDEYIKQHSPAVWENYLIRFKTEETRE